MAYDKFHRDDLTLRDLLAIDRTVLANERTLLSYVRTTLAIMAAGASILHFLDGTWTDITGWTLIGVSIPVLAIGVHHFLVARNKLAALRR